MFKVNNKNHARATLTGVFVNIYSFEHVDAGWVRSSHNDNYI